MYHHHVPFSCYTCYHVYIHTNYQIISWNSLWNIAPEHITGNEELKSELTLFCKCETDELRELQSGAEKRMLATLTSYERSCFYASASHMWDSNVGQDTHKSHCHVPQEMPGNGRKLNVTPAVPKVYCVLFISFMGVRMTLQLGCRQSVPQLFITIPNTWWVLMEATICQKGNSHIFSQPKMRKSCYSKVADIIRSGKGGGWR